MTTVCRLCCLADTKLTNSVNDNVIVDFLTFVPKLLLSDHPSMSARVCQLCFGKAKICVDFVHKIQQSQRNFNTKGRISVQASQNTAGVSTPQDALNKMKRIGGINIKKVEPKSDRFFNEDSDDSFSWPMEPDCVLNWPADASTVNASLEPSPPRLPKTPTSKPSMSKNSDATEVVLLDSDSDYQPEASDSDDEPLVKTKPKASTSRKRAANKDSDDDYQPSAKKPARVDNRANARQIFVNSPIKFTCAKCKNSFANIKELAAHMKSKECFEENFTCEICGKSYATKIQKSKHMNSHKAKEAVFCDQCGKEFKRTHDLYTHLESTHNRVIRKDCVYRCNKCTEVLPSHLDLMVHMKEHTKEADNVTKLCEICAKEITGKKAYRAHMHNHQKKRNHSCQICGKAFYEKFQVTQHMHIHSGIKEYHCDFCEKSYAKRDSLRLHKKKMHPNEVAAAKETEADLTKVELPLE